VRNLPILVTAAGLLLAAGCVDHRLAPICVDADDLPPQWQTTAEQTAYAATGRYDETVDWCQRLAAFSPFARCVSIGQTATGRDLPLLILSASGDFDAAGARNGAKPVVLFVGCIHPGECCGKDAMLALARDILVTGERQALIANATVLMLPMFNADGHERFSPYNRINQYGPEQMGWRVTATNLNLNRDFAKADSVEMRAWLGLWTTWQPDLVIDTHTTNGADHRYELMYTTTTDPLAAAPIRDWTRAVYDANVSPALRERGWSVMPYSFPRDRRDPSAGINVAGGMGARYSTGYAALTSRVGVLSEAHALKTYAARVRVTYDLLVETLRVVGANAATLRAATRAADAALTAQRGANADGVVPLNVAHTDDTKPFVYAGWEIESRESPITGKPIVAYTDVPRDYPTRLFDGLRIETRVTPPLAYLIPPEWQSIIDRLHWHGVATRTLDEALTIAVDSYRFTDVTFPSEPYEGRHGPRYEVQPIAATRTFPLGTVVVDLRQPRARLAAHLLEPEGPDSLVAWGLLNAIFERKEYFETYAMEPIARQMYADDPALRAAFEERVAADPDFAANPRARLEFFYARSPYYDAHHNVYPIARVVDPAVWRRVQAATE
jgi:hypothetical protein